MRRLLIILLMIMCSSSGFCANREVTPMIHNAHWIWIQDSKIESGKAVYMAKAFNLDAKPINAIIQITCDDNYKIWINGKPVGETVRKGPDSWKVADTWNVLPLLKQGDNYIAVQAQSAKETGALLAVVAIGCAGSKTVTVNTDSSWEAAAEPGDNWQQNASSGKWEPVHDYGCSATTPPWFYPRTSTKLMDMVSEKMRLESRILSASSVKAVAGTDAQVDGIASSKLTIQAHKSNQKALLIYDFGREVVGQPIVIGSTIGKCSINISCGEYAAECDSPYQPAFSAGFERGGIRWSTSERRAFRYLKLTVEPESIASIERVQVEAVGCPVDEAGSFACSDDTLNKIWDVSRYTLRQCMQDTFEDGIKRDRLLWVADLRIEALVNYYSFGSRGLAKRGLLQMADVQMPDGMIIAVGPNPSSTYLPDFCAYYVLSLADYYRYSGDKDTLKLLYPNLQRLMEWFKSNCDDTGLFRNADRPGWWMFVDWDESLEKKDRVTALEALYYWALKDAAYVAQEVGEKKDAREYSLRAEQLKKSMNSTMWNEPQGAYIDCVTDQGQSAKVHKQPNALALLAGLSDSAKSETILASMTDSSKMPPVTTPFMNFYVASALFEGGQSQQALDLIRSYWGGMVQRGATTFWEKFDPNWPDPYEKRDLSYCHGWSAGPGAMLPAYVAGVRPLEAGFKSVLLKPDLADLAWAKATVPVPAGKVRVEWKREPGGITGEVNLPSRCSGLLRLPKPSDGIVYALNGKRAVFKLNGPNVETSITGGMPVSITLEAAQVKR